MSSYQDRLLAAIPGGAHTYSRGFDQFPSNAPPILDRGKGAYVYDPAGTRYLDYGMALRAVNIGYAEDEIDAAAFREIKKGNNLTRPSMIELEAAELLVDLIDSVDMVKFTKNGSTAVSAAVKIARAYTGRPKIISFYRSYHGGTAGALAATGEPRGWLQPPLPGFLHVLSPYHGISRGLDSADDALSYLEEVIQLEGPQSIAAIILESVVGTNGILIPPDGYYQGLRVLCDKYGILLIADEVMTGFGRTGAWFAVDHWKIVPDILVMAKGLTSAYVALGAVGIRRKIADHFKDKVFYGGLTYNSHPLGCAAALATIAVYEEDKLIERAKKMGVVMRRMLEDLKAKHPCVGDVRSIGLFGIVELVKNRKTMEPLAPFNGTSTEMQALGKFFREEGLYTFVRWDGFFTNPPLCITEAELAEAFAIIDKGLYATDKAIA